MARIVLPVAGAVIGYFASGGNPMGAQAGWLAGSMIAAVAFRETIRNVQPRLDDLKVTTGSYGHTLPYVDGAMRVGGWVAWASDRREIRTTTRAGGKGGPKVENTTITYECDMLIMLASHKIGGVRRIWMDGELVWSRASESGFATVSASSTFCRRVTVYTGDASQLPDPTYEAAVGVGNAPAYRERGSLFLEGLDLGQSGHIRNLTFEVYTAGSEAVARDSLQSRAPESIFAGTPALRSGTFDFICSSVSGATAYVFQWEPTGLALVRSFAILETGGGNAGRPLYGFSDVDCIFMHNLVFAPANAYMYTSDGARLDFSTPNGARIFCRNKSDVYLADSNNVAHRYGLGGSSTMQSVVLGVNVKRISANAKHVVVLTLMADNTHRLFFLHRTNLTVDYFIANSRDGHLTTDSAGSVYIIDHTGVYQVVGSTLVLVFNVVNFGPEYKEWSTLGYENKVLMGSFQSTNNNDPSVHAAWNAVQLSTVSLDGAVNRLHERSGMALADVNATALSSKTLRGFAVTQVSTTRTALEMLMAAHFFEAVKDQGIRYVNRGGSSALTIPYDDLGAIEAGGEPVEPMEIIENNDIELPAFIAVRYSNLSDDYQEGLEYSDRLVTRSTETRVIEVPMAMTPTEARHLAQKLANDLQVSKTRVGPLSVQRKYAALQPTDVVTVQGRDGLSVRMRVEKREEAAGIIKLDGVIDDASVITGTAVTDTTYTGGFTITLPARTSWAELDIPLLRTVDDGASFEVAFAGVGANWRGAVYFGGDDDANLEQITSVTTETVTGTCLTALGSVTGNMLQVTGFLDVQVDGELVSVTYDQLMNGSNVAAVSSVGRWEIIGFQSATLLSISGDVRTYRLRNFLRHLKGTEGITHAVGDRFVLMQTNGIRRVPLAMGELQRVRRYKAVSAGRQLSSVDSRAFTWAGDKLKPLAPVYVRGIRDTVDLVITWARRTRHEDNWLLGSLPLGEVSESYVVEIMSGSTVVRTITSTTTSVTYTNAQQVADFGSAQASVSVRVYQISDSIGRGHVAAATV